MKTPEGIRTLAAMSKLRTLGGDLEGALDRVKVPSYVIDSHGIIRWINPAAHKLVGDVRGRQFTSVVARKHVARVRRSPSTSSARRTSTLRSSCSRRTATASRSK